MSKKELFQEQVEESIFKIADYIISNSENDIFANRAKSIRDTLKLNIYVFNEAMGRLKAIGFLSSVKKFNKTQLSQRKDNELYYYKITPNKHPSKFINTEEAKVLLLKRQRKLSRKREFEKELILEVFGLNK